MFSVRIAERLIKPVFFTSLIHSIIRATACENYSVIMLENIVNVEMAAKKRRENFV